MGQAGRNAFGLCCIEQCPGLPGQLSLGCYARRQKHDREVTGEVCKHSAPGHISRAKRKGRQRPDQGQPALPSLTARFREEIPDRLLPSSVLFSASGNLHRRDLCTSQFIPHPICLEREKNPAPQVSCLMRWLSAACVPSSAHS